MIIYYDHFVIQTNNYLFFLFYSYLLLETIMNKDEKKN